MSSIENFVWSVQQLLAGVGWLAAVVLCVTPSGMALFDLPAGFHCTTTVLSPPASLPLNSISEEAWIRSLPLLGKWKSLSHLTWFNSKIKLWGMKSWGGIIVHSRHWTGISWSLKTWLLHFPPTALHLQRTIQFLDQGVANAAWRLFPWRWPDTYDMESGAHSVERDYQFTGKPSQVSSLFEGIKKCKTTRRSVICNSKKKKVFTVFQHSEPLSSWVHLRSEPQVAKKEGHSSWERHFTLLFLSLSRPALWVVAGRLPSGVCSTADCSSLPKDTDSRDLMQTERHYRK